MAINWNNVPVLTDRSADLYMRSMGNLSNAIQGVGNSGINFLQRMIDRQDLIDAKNKASNTQMILNRLAQADSLEDKQRMLAEGYGDLGVIRSMLGGGEFDERLVNANLNRWNTDISNRYTANQNLLQSTPEGEKAKIDAQYAIATGNLEGMQQALKSPYLDPTTRQQLVSASVGREAQTYTRGVEENLRRLKEEEAQREIQRDATNKKNLAFGEYLKGISADKEYISLMQQEIGGLFSYYSYGSPYDILNDFKSSDQEKIKKANDFKQHFLQVLAKSPEKSNEIINSFLNGYGESAEYYGVGKDEVEAEKQEFLKFLGIELPKTNTNTGSENQTTTTTPTVSDTPERKAILDTVNKKEKDIKDITEQKAKGFTKPYANFKNEEERNKYYDNLLSKTEKELTDARNKLTEYDAKQNQTTNNQTTTELSKEDEEKIADIRKQILNLKDDNTLSTEGKNAKAYELNQQIEDIVAKTYPKKEEGVVNNTTPTTNTATNTTVNTGSNENLVAKSSEPEKIDNSIPETNNTSNTNTTVPITATTNNNNVSSGSNESLTTKANKGEQDKINAEIDADIKKSLSGSTLNENDKEFIPTDIIQYDEYVDNENKKQNTKLFNHSLGKQYKYLISEQFLKTNPRIKEVLAENKDVQRALINLSDNLPILPEPNKSGKRGVSYESDLDYSKTPYKEVNVKNKITRIQGSIDSVKQSILEKLNKSYLYLEKPSIFSLDNILDKRLEMSKAKEFKYLHNDIAMLRQWSLGEQTEPESTREKGEKPFKDAIQHSFLDDQWAIWFSDDRSILKSLIDGKFIKQDDNDDTAKFKLQALYAIQQLGFPNGYGNLNRKEKGNMETQLIQIIPAIADLNNTDVKNIKEIYYKINNPNLVDTEIMAYLLDDENKTEPIDAIKSLKAFSRLGNIINPSKSLTKVNYETEKENIYEKYRKEQLKYRGRMFNYDPSDPDSASNYNKNYLAYMESRRKKQEELKNLRNRRYTH